MAADPENQILYLRSDPNIPLLPVDELALEFDDIFQVMRSNDELNVKFTKNELSLLDQLDAYLERCSGEENADLWTFKALADAEEWKFIRSLAKRIIG